MNELLFIHKKNKEQQFKIVEKLVKEKKVLEDLIKAESSIVVKWTKGEDQPQSIPISLYGGNKK